MASNLDPATVAACADASYTDMEDGGRVWHNLRIETPPGWRGGLVAFGVDTETGGMTDHSDPPCRVIGLPPYVPTRDAQPARLPGTL